LETGMPDIDWMNMFAFTVSPLELFLRGSITYLFLFLLFRFVVHRDIGSMTVSDLLVLVIIADASQNAMSNDYKSLTDGGVVILTIIGWSALLNYLSFHYPIIRRFIVPRPVLIVKDGQKQRPNLKREKITDDDLDEMLREHQIEDILEVKRAYLEADGQITVLKQKKDGDSSPPPKHFSL
jgi:uncharacterized membrane protein YcaP (DUF421 family)